MQTIRSRIIYHLLKLASSPFDARNTLTQQRAKVERQSKYLIMPRRVEVQPVLIDDIYAEWVQPPKKTAKGAILFLHGGGYTMGSCNSHRAFAARIAISCQLPVLLINYR